MTSVLLILTAFIAYIMGSFSSRSISSRLIFRSNLRKLGTGNAWISNFHRIYGVKGFVKLLIVEVIIDLLPILIGGWLLSIKDAAVVGRAFAGFCLVMGRMYPATFRFKGSYAVCCLIVTAMSVEISLGIVVLLAAVGMIWWQRYFAFGAVVGALVYVIATLLILDDRLLTLLALFTAAVMVFRHIPSIWRIVRGTEEKLSLEEDLTYKLDEKF